MNTDTCYFAYFENMYHYFWMIKWMKLRVIFKYQKFSLGVLLSICLIFSQFQPGIAYKSASCIKKRVNHRERNRSNNSGPKIDLSGTL